MRHPTSRAERRANLDTKKVRVRQHYGGWAGKTAETLGKVAVTPTPCSCYMCGNPRKHFGHKYTVRDQRLLGLAAENYR